MKKIGIIIGTMAIFTFGTMSAQTVKPHIVPATPANKSAVKPAPQLSKSVLVFEETTHDFGNITQGDKVAYTFKFKNTGTEPLILSNVLTTCGCTATNWPRNPIAPGGSNEIAATFNSAGKNGKQNKVITVISNASNGNQRVSIISNVAPKPVVAPTVAPAPTVIKGK